MTRRHAETAPTTAFPLLSPTGEGRYVDAGTQRKFSSSSSSPRPSGKS
ncbi:MAG: hypothetical protein KME57_16195 [Scytonema hyalinum WJT4-NPBG1]|nr:hypothetical protein [Scytonema hyalinum WJT4-NPBG1]